MTIPAILSAETAAALAEAQLRATLGLLHAELSRILTTGDIAGMQRLDDLLFAAQDAVCGVERMRDEVADLKDEYTHHRLMAGRAA